MFNFAISKFIRTLATRSIIKADVILFIAYDLSFLLILYFQFFSPLFYVILFNFYSLKLHREIRENGYSKRLKVVVTMCLAVMSKRPRTYFNWISTFVSFLKCFVNIYCFSELLCYPRSHLPKNRHCRLCSSIKIL